MFGDQDQAQFTIRAYLKSGKNRSWRTRRGPRDGGDREDLWVHMDHIERGGNAIPGEVQKLEQPEVHGGRLD